MAECLAVHDGRAYFDYNATAPIRAEVRAQIEPILFGDVHAGGFGNPSSVHWAGQSARKHLERARQIVARAFARKPSEVIFTSGGSEADNLALFGIARHPTRKNARVVISAVEHPAIVEAANRLAQDGVDVERVGVDREGRLDLSALDRALEKKTTIVSVMAVNNETGVISPIDEVIARARARGAIVHVDAVQAVGRIPLPIEADLISFSGHKLGGMKGAGALIVRDDIALFPSVVGGPQERGHRAGTESVAAIVALAAALDRSLAERDAEARRLEPLRARIDRALHAIEKTRILGEHAPRIAGTTCAVFGDVDGESVLQALDLEGIAASSGSACSSGSLEPSHVLLAMGVPAKEALSSVRFSMGWATTEVEVDRLVALLPRVVAQVRRP